MSIEKENVTKTEEEAIETKIIGMTTKDAYQLLQENNLTGRIVKENGETQMVTMDYHPNRLNLEIEKDIVVSIQSRG